MSLVTMDFIDISGNVQVYHEKKQLPCDIDFEGKKYPINLPKRVLVFKQRQKIHQFLADEVFRAMINSMGQGVIFPTGSTYHGFYEHVVDQKAKFYLALKHSHHALLDELYPLSPKDANWPIAFGNDIRDRLIEPLGLEQAQFIRPDSTAREADLEVKRFNYLLSIRKWAIALLGIGPDGHDAVPASSHIGFIPKGTPPDAEAMLVDLDLATIEANRRSAPDPENYPTQAITQGPANIGRAERLILTAIGRNKSKNIADTLLEVPSLDRPSSLIHVISKEKTVVMDVEASDELIRRLRP